MNKNAYPHDDYDLPIRSPRSVQKWMSKMTEIFVLAQKGHDFKDAFESVTSGWDVMEKMDFKKWMEFYQENAHNKYKIAFRAPSLIDNGHGSFVPNMDNLRAGLPFKQPDMTPYSQIEDAPGDENDLHVARQETVKKKIQALVSRLSAAERLATNPEVQVALKKCIDMPLIEWLSMLQQLKREIQLAPMRATSLVLMDDIVVKNANRAIAAGKAAAGHLLLKIAQPAPGGDIVPMNPVVAPMAGQPVAPAQDGNEAIQEFLKNMNGDIASADDEEETEEEDDLAFLTVTAQMAPEEAVAAPPAPEELEVTEDELQPTELQEPLTPAEVEDTSGPMDAIDLALQNVTVSDIVSRLEGIASLFKNRQIARQLSVVDLMMDKMGIAPFFPSLAEAMRSALESNQYCQSRIEEILARLRGTMETQMSQQLEMSQEVENTAPNPLQQSLQQDEDAEKARRDRRKQMQQEEEENAAMQGPPVEQVNAPAEIAGPAEVQTQPEAVRPVG